VSDHAAAYQQMIDREATKVLGAIPLILPFLLRRDEWGG
jgi:hypothetical protein